MSSLAGQVDIFSPGSRVAASVLYGGVLVAYTYVTRRGENVPSVVVELLIVMVPSALLGFVFRSWLVLLVPLAVAVLILALFGGFGPAADSGVALVFFAVLLPAAWLAAAVGVLAARAL